MTPEQLGLDMYMIGVSTSVCLCADHFGVFRYKGIVNARLTKKPDRHKRESFGRYQMEATKTI